MKKSPKDEVVAILRTAQDIKEIRRELEIELKEYQECLSVSYKEVNSYDGCYRSGHQLNYCG